jgi:pimeloyl-ACP methyl ester carboxylesterase
MTASVPHPSEEQYAALPSGVTLCYQTFGDPADEPMLLVMGLGGPMTWWDPDLCQGLADEGFFVIRFDNRDSGRSSKVDGRVSRTMIVRSFLGRRIRVPYTLDDMAEDGFGLLDHLGLGAAHLVGVSMGGMIVQAMTLLHPERVLSLTSMMSTTGRRTVGWQDPRLFPMLLAKSARTREEYIRGAARTWRILGSPLYPGTPEFIAAQAAETWDRGLNPAGTARQMTAILTQPDRTARLRAVRVPTLVIHGLSDKMVHVSGGRATSHAIPGAELLLVPGMGHDLPLALNDTFIEAVARTAHRAARPARDACGT